MQVSWKLALLVVVLGAIIGFLLRPVLLPEVEIRRIIQAEKVDSTDIIQKARIGWIVQDELDEELRKAYNLLDEEKRFRHLKYETKYNFVDSVRVKDSVAVRYIPYYFADTTFSFHKKTEQWEMNQSIGFRQRFYPHVERFQTHATLDKFEITITYEQPWRFDYMSGGIGFGTGTLFTILIASLVK